MGIFSHFLVWNLLLFPEERNFRSPQGLTATSDSSCALPMLDVWGKCFSETASFSLVFPSSLQLPAECLKRTLDDRNYRRFIFKLQMHRAKKFSRECLSKWFSFYNSNKSFPDISTTVNFLDLRKLLAQLQLFRAKTGHLTFQLTPRKLNFFSVSLPLPRFDGWVECIMHAHTLNVASVDPDVMKSSYPHSLLQRYSRSFEITRFHLTSLLC